MFTACHRLASLGGAAGRDARQCRCPAWAAPQQKPASKYAKAAHHNRKPVADGVWEAYIPTFDDKDEEVKPEFAVIRLTAAKYQEFEQGGKAFLNDNKVFSKKINQLEPCPSLTPQAQPPKVTYYYLVVPHWPGSTAFCTAYTGWSPPKE